MYSVYNKAKRAVIISGLFWLVGYMSGFFISSEELFTEVWYNCDSLAKLFILSAAVILSSHYAIRGLYYILVCMKGWAYGNVFDEFFLDPQKFQYSEVVAAAIFALWCWLDYHNLNRKIIDRIKKIMSRIKKLITPDKWKVT